ncbi:MAG TPA: hypothetical protein VII49_08680 [Rhizomicrobium sp.]
MIGFRADWLRVAAIAAALGAILIWPLAAVAQRVDSRAPTGAPMPLVGEELTPQGEQAVIAQAPGDGRHREGIQVRSLGLVDGSALGLLDSANGGLGSDIWQNTSRARIEEMLKRLPLATSVASVHALARRLVLTTADAPVGDAPHAFLSVRLHALLDAGLLQDAGELAVKIIPGNDPELAGLVAESILFADRGNDACGPDTNSRLASGDQFWIELRAFCYAAAGDSGALDLTRAVMKAQSLEGHAFEILLDDFVTGRSIDPGQIFGPDALDVFLFQKVGLPVDPRWSLRLGVPGSVVAMRDARNTPDKRLQAAEEPARAGASATSELAAIADAQTLSPERLSSAASIAPTLPFLAGQTMLRQAVRDTADPATRKKLLFEALALAYEKNLLPLAAQLQGSAASAVIPYRMDRSHAALMASTLMLGGRADAAARWFDVLDPSSDSAKPLIHLLQIELNLVAPNPARTFEAQGALSWFAAQGSTTQPIGGERTLTVALLALGTYGALGLTLTPEAETALAQLRSQQLPGREPKADVLALLAAASKDSGKRGEALLAMLDFIGPDGPGDVAPDAIVACVRALMQMGYADAAHELAIDALLLRRPGPGASPVAAVP